MLEQGFQLYVAEHEDAIEKLAKYEDIDLSPEEFKESIDFVLELNKKVHKVIEDLRYYLDTNEENGVVYIPKFVIEKMVSEHLKQTSKR
jgi:hemerythrin-like domain-containing protein